jgi:hypothetical protein
LHSDNEIIPTFPKSLLPTENQVKPNNPLNSRFLCVRHSIIHSQMEFSGTFPLTASEITLNREIDKKSNLMDDSSVIYEKHSIYFWMNWVIKVELPGPQRGKEK